MALHKNDKSTSHKGSKSKSKKSKSKKPAKTAAIRVKKPGKSKRGRV